MIQIQLLTNIHWHIVVDKHAVKCMTTIISVTLAAVVVILKDGYKLKSRREKRRI